jgi:hypothetical protein
MRSFIGHQQYLVEKTAKRAIQTKLVDAGMGKVTDPERVSNPKKISNAAFSKLIKDTLPEVGDIQIIAANEPGSESGSFPTFVFMYDGEERKMVLTAEIKGRGSKGTIAQEVSWLLALSALYNDNTIKTPQQLQEGMIKKMAYQKVYDEKGSPLNESKAKGLIAWLFNKKQEKTWLPSHLGQCKKFINTYTKAPSKFIKDRPNIPIVLLAKKIFSTSVPDQEFDKDKWNPADVWLEYEDVPAYTSLTQLNNYLEDSILGPSGTIGVSLKLGTNSVTRINMKGERPEYEVTDFDLWYGDLFAQNVPAEYKGNELAGYSVTYRVFDANAKSTIRGEANRKLSKAAHGKVYLKYLDFLMGGKRTYVRRVEGVKGILVKELGSKSYRYEFTRDGITAFNKIKKVWPLLRDSDIMKFAGTAFPANYDKLLDEKEFLDYLGEYAQKKKLKEKQMQTRVSVRFQTLRLGSLFAGIKKGSKDRLHEVALGMLLYGKSESSWSAPHVKAQ